MLVTDIYLSPHDDDDALFGSYVLIPNRPRIIVVLRSFVEAGWTPPIHYETREAESAAAAEVLGCEHEHWTYPDNAPDWNKIRARMETLRPERVWAPLPEEGGHAHHNIIGSLAKDLWPQTTFYATYTHANGKTTTGNRVTPEPGWVETKLKAMACYQSQASHPQCAVAFNGWALDEYLS